MLKDYKLSTKITWFLLWIGCCNLASSIIPNTFISGCVGTLVFLYGGRVTPPLGAIGLLAMMYDMLF